MVPIIFLLLPEAAPSERLELPSPHNDPVPTRPGECPLAPQKHGPFPPDRQLESPDLERSLRYD